MAGRDKGEARVIRRKARCHDQDFIYAALGGLTLCVAALYMAVALPRVAPLLAPKILNMAHQAPGPAVAWVSVQNVADRGGAVAEDDSSLEKPTQVTRIGTTEKLAGLFADMKYSLETGRGDQVEVPRVYLANLPSDFKSAPSVDTRKELFIRTMLPLVLKVNEGILLDRGQLLALRHRAASGRAPTAEEAAWLNDLTQRYGLEKPDFDQLLARVDIIPPALALAQAAEESGWGTSRFTRQGNAAFGQYTFSDDLGIVPDRRDDGKHHLIRSYDHLLESVNSYALNLNTHDAYKQFRKQRAEMRAHGQNLEGFKLAAALTSYSERGDDYVDTIQTIMRKNNLEALDHAKLRGDQIVDLLSAGK